MSGGDIALLEVKGHSSGIDNGQSHSSRTRSYLSQMNVTLLGVSLSHFVFYIITVDCIEEQDLFFLPMAYLSGIHM